MDVNFGHHFWTSLLDFTFIRHFWTSLIDVTFGCYFWTSLLDVTFGCHFLMSFFYVTLRHSFSTPPFIVTFCKKIQIISPNRLVALALQQRTIRRSWPTKWPWCWFSPWLHRFCYYCMGSVSFSRFLQLSFLHILSPVKDIFIAPFFVLYLY